MELNTEKKLWKKLGSTRKMFHIVVGSSNFYVFQDKCEQIEYLIIFNQKIIFLQNQNRIHVSRLQGGPTSRLLDREIIQCSQSNALELLLLLTFVNGFHTIAWYGEALEALRWMHPLGAIQELNLHCAVSHFGYLEQFMRMQIFTYACLKPHNGVKI